MSLSGMLAEARTAYETLRTEFYRSELSEAGGKG
jgi:hypothetical protein